LTTGQIDAAALSLPLNYAAEEQGFNEIGRFVDVIPNYQLASLSVKRSWAEKNRPLLVRFMRSMVQTYRWIYQSKEPAVDFLAQEMKLKRDQRDGAGNFTGTRMWHPEGISTSRSAGVAQIYAEQARQRPVPRRRSTWTRAI
jgi:hypothetical protein